MSARTIVSVHEVDPAGGTGGVVGSGSLIDALCVLVHPPLSASLAKAVAGGQEPRLRLAIASWDGDDQTVEVADVRAAHVPDPQLGESAAQVVVLSLERPARSTPEPLTTGPLTTEPETTGPLTTGPETTELLSATPSSAGAALADADDPDAEWADLLPALTERLAQPVSPSSDARASVVGPRDTDTDLGWVCRLLKPRPWFCTVPDPDDESEPPTQ